MRRGAAFFALAFVAASAFAQLECRTDPQDRDLQFAGSAGSDRLEFRGRNPARGLGATCVLTLDCRLAQPAEKLEYFMMPQRAGDPPAVWSIRRVVFRHADGSQQECRVTASSEARPPLEEPPPFIRKDRRK
jgi:hypothetical protein